MTPVTWSATADAHEQAACRCITEATQSAYTREQDYQLNLAQVRATLAVSQRLAELTSWLSGGRA